jgi:hypothetical protein
MHETRYPPFAAISSGDSGRRSPIRVGEVPSSNLGAPIVFKNREYPANAGERPRKCWGWWRWYSWGFGDVRVDWDRRGTAAAVETDRKRAAAVREWTGETPAMGASPEIELVRPVRDVLLKGGPDVLGEVLAPDAQWYGAEDGQLCDGDGSEPRWPGARPDRGDDPRRVARDLGVPSRAAGAA